jgi:hypothetical protein
MLRALAESLLLGAGRRPVDWTAIDGDLGRVLRQLAGRDEVAQALAAAAILAPYQAAGHALMAATDSNIAPCAAETAPLCATKAADLLDEILSQAEGLLEEWLRRAVQRSVLVPPAMLPRLLDAGYKNKGRRESIQRVIGQRGAWLAAQNPNWAYAVAVGTGIEDERIWEEGDEEARIAWLTQLRERDPARGLAHIIAVWHTEVAATRARFVQALQIGLSVEDEPFLENCLDDRGQQVRKAAVALLTRLPESRLGCRMIERLAQIVKVAPRPKTGGRAARLVQKMTGQHEAVVRFIIETPPEFTAVDNRDGLVEKVGTEGGRLGPVAYRLRALIAATPLIFWERFDSGSPTTLLDALAGCEWQGAMISGLIDATLHQRHPDWARALLAMPIPHTPERRSLVLVLPEVEREPIFVAALQHDVAEGSQQGLIEWILHHPAPWGAVLSRAVLHGYREHLPHAKTAWSFHQALDALALKLATELLGEATEGWPVDHGCGPAFDQRLNEFLRIIRLRRRLDQAIA